MPGRTLATWYGSGGDPSENSYHPLEPSFYSRPPPQPGSAQYDQQHQYDTNYGYYPLNQASIGNPGSGGPYPDQQRNFSPNYTQQSPHYAPLSPASPATTGYHYNHQPPAQQTHHGMNYNNPQQSIYSSTVSPGHYGSPNHGQHSSYSPSSSQQWPPQQASPADYTHHSSSSPQRSVLAGSPSATPSPAHTPTSPPPPTMSGQFPAHHHGRHPPMGSSQSAQGHGLAPWGHPGAGQGQGMGMHPGGGMGGPPPQPPNYYPSPHPSMGGPGRGIQGPPQHAHMSSAPGADRHSPLHPVVPGAWNNLGMPVTKAPGGPPSTSHPQTNSGSNSGGPGNPLFSLQMLVNQDMNRNAAAAAAATAAAQAGSYRGQTPTAAHQQESVDLSPASGEAYPRMPQQSVPIPLTRTDKQPEHSSLRNGSIIASSTSVSSTNVTSPPTPLNGEVSSDSGIGSSSIAPTPSSLPDNSTLNRDSNKTKSVAENKSPLSKETVSVIAQTPPREKPKCAPQVVTTVASSSSPSPQSSETKLEKKGDSHQSASSELRMDSSKRSPTSGRDIPVQPIRPSSADSQERSNPIIRTNTIESSPVSVESTTNVLTTNSNSASVKQSEDSLSIPSPTQSLTKESTSPVRSPKSASIKRTKKVDSILENLVESGSKKLGSTGAGTEQPPQVPVSTVVVAPASVIVSPSITNEDSSSGFGRDVRTPSPGSQKLGGISHHKSPTTVREEDVVSPTFSNDDVDNGKPRRKRKLDKPIRVSKTSSDTEGTKSSPMEESAAPEENQKPQEVNLQMENKDSNIESPSSEAVVEQSSIKSIENLTKDLSNNTGEKLETTRRRSSSEGSSPSQSPKSANQRIRRKSASDQQDDADALLSALVPEQLDKPQEPKPEVKNAFIEVETELEKMFAGIVETGEAVDPLKLDDTSSPVSMEVSPTTKALETLTNLGSTSVESKPAANLKRGRPKGSRNGTRRSSESIFGTSSTDSTPRKKKKQQKRPFEDSPGTSQSKKVKRSKLFQGENSSNSRDSPLPKKKGLIKSEPSSGGQRDLVQAAASYDSGSNTSSSRSRGPVIHVEGPKDSPYYVSVINFPTRGEDEEGNEKGGTKKQAAGSTRRKNTSYHNDLEYRGKVSRASGRSLGLFSSTLSARYDAHTTDPTWICVFCKRGPHSTTGQGALGNGDLFGPYLVGKERADDGGMGSPFIGCEPSADERDITEEQKRGGKNKRSLRGAEMVEQFRQKMSKKVKRSLSIDNSPVLGMVPIAPSGTGCKDEACFEVWVHEECAVWAAGVHLVGSRIVGLQEAVWGAVRTFCSKCGEGGANVGCVRRACEWRLHYGCALSQGWDLDEEAYIARCNQHKNGTYSTESILPT